MAKPNVNTDPMSKRPDYLKNDKIEMPVEESIRFPRLKLMQALSPEVTPGHERFIPDPVNQKKPMLSPGELVLQTESSNRVIDGDEGIVVIPIAIRKRYVEYVPRDAGGGFVASYDSKEEMEANREAGNDVQTTIEFLVVEAGLKPEETTPFTITFDTISKLGTAKRWAGYIHQYETLEGAQYLITGKQTLNKKKQSYYNFEVKPVGWTSKPTLEHIQAMSPALLPLFENKTNEEI